MIVDWDRIWGKEEANSEHLYREIEVEEDMFSSRNEVSHLVV